jgi:hypothetical protein
MVVITRDEDKPYVAGDEGIGNRRDGPAIEIGVEDRVPTQSSPTRLRMCSRCCAHACTPTQRLLSIKLGLQGPPVRPIA